MPDVNTVACDVCGVQRRDVNRWWMLWVNWIRPKGQLCIDEFEVGLWRSLTREDVERAIACGEEHAHELFSRWLVSRSFLAPSQRPLATSHSPLATDPSPSVPLPNPNETEKQS